MIQVFIWGAGHYAQQVIDEIDNRKVNILGILDHDTKKWGTKLFYPISVISPLEIERKDFDYLIISVKKYEKIQNECNKLCVEPAKIIVYWKNEFDKPVFKERSKQVEELMQEKRLLHYRLDSAPYEWSVKPSPEILSGVKLLEKIIIDHSSLCRFGDGEFEMIRGRERPRFQKTDRELAGRLKEVLLSKDNSINIAIAQNFMFLDQYKENAADGIREYMYGDTRDYILGLLEKGRIYYDAYVTRPYIIYRNRRNADEIFPLFKKIWKDKDVVIVEGEHSRIGVGNDLMEQAHSVSRILCPSENAWDKYSAILNTILGYISPEKLICISLGPCATVLAYDLAKKGYQALDIGQLDNEYEWYLQNAKTRVLIPGKLVAELETEQKLELDNEMDYTNQVIVKIK